MWLILMVLFMTGFVLAVLKLSLMKGVWWIPAGIITAGAPMLFRNMTVRLNIQDVEALLGDYGFITTVSTVVILESLVLLLFSVSLMSDHFSERKNRLWPKLIFLPSLAVITGLVLFQVLLFNMISGKTYLSLAAYEAAAIAVLFTLGWAFALLIMRDWLQRLELTVVFAFLQLIIAMFIPIIAAGLEMPVSNFEIHTGSILFTFFVLLSTASAGYFLRIKPLKYKKGHTQ